MRVFCFLLTALSFSSFATAQSAEDSVKTVINRFFAGMKAANPEEVRASFTDSAILQTIGRTREGKWIVRDESLADFAAQVGKMKKDSADERIQFDIIRVDGPLAIAWTPYEFFFNGQFSHCGVNSFQLVRLDGKWKIQYIIDTRRRTGCR